MAVPSLGNNKNNIITSSNFDAESCSIFPQNSRICICLLCGLPGSGKTTLLQSLISRNNRLPSIKRQSENHIDSSNSTADELEKCVVVGIEYDSVLPMHQSTVEKSGQEQELNGKWKCSRNQILSATEALIQHVCDNSSTEFLPPFKPQEKETHVRQKFLEMCDSLKTELKNNENKVLFVVDDNMYFRSMRYEYYKLARKYQTGYCQIYVQCSLDKAMERNKSRGELSQVPEEVIRRMSGKIEPPDPEIYSWETNSITVSSEEDINIDPVDRIVQKAFMSPVQPLEGMNEDERLKSRIACSASLLHQADLILRKCVATKIAGLKVTVRPHNLKELSRHVCQVKEKVLRDLKNGQIPVVLSSDLDITNSAQDTSHEFYRYIEDIFLNEMSRS